MAIVGDIGGCIGAATGAIILARALFIDGVKHAVVLKNLQDNDKLTMANAAAIETSHKDLKQAFTDHIEVEEKNFANVGEGFTDVRRALKLAAEEMAEIKAGLNGPLSEKIKKSVIAEWARMNRETLPCQSPSPAKTD